MILRPTTSPEDWKAFLAQPDLHWKPGRSAMETAFAWEGAKGLPLEIAAMLPGAKLLLAIPEYKVALPGGGADSQNDVFALVRDENGLIPVMVEAKRDESFGPTLGEWLVDASTGKKARLAAICDLLGLDPAALDPGLRYQLFHRTASALVTAARFHADRAAMVVQSFSPERRWYEDFAAFAALFGDAPAPSAALNRVLPNGKTLLLGWASCPLLTEGIAP
ncbi:DUF6946 family protein [Maritimibacter alexandrii]|uniref:DUF6946 family protein n=1 Tax=Maritimibacter alexandrii TaxID=2570355 RepID=UPI0014873D49|nr:hypothetical protein [Maritimibacter alexandrii]